MTTHTRPRPCGGGAGVRPDCKHHSQRAGGQQRGGGEVGSGRQQHAVPGCLQCLGVFLKASSALRQPQRSSVAIQLDGPRAPPPARTSQQLRKGGISIATALQSLREALPDDPSTVADGRRAARVAQALAGHLQPSGAFQAAVVGAGNSLARWGPAATAPWTALGWPSSPSRWGQPRAACTASSAWQSQVALGSAARRSSARRQPRPPAGADAAACSPRLPLSQIEHELEMLQWPGKEWVVPRTPEGSAQPMLDVLIVGAGGWV